MTFYVFSWHLNHRISPGETNSALLPRGPKWVNETDRGPASKKRSTVSSSFLSPLPASTGLRLSQPVSPRPDFVHRSFKPSLVASTVATCHHILTSASPTPVFSSPIHIRIPTPGRSVEAEPPPLRTKGCFRPLLSFQAAATTHFMCSSIAHNPCHSRRRYSCQGRGSI